MMEANDAFLREKTYHKQQFTIYNYYNGMKLCKHFP